MPAIETLTPIALGLMMMGMGLALKTSDFSKLITAPKPVILGVLAQMIGLPILGFSIAVGFGIPPSMAVGVMILVCCAGGVVSGLLTQLAGGDVALSIAMTSISMLFGTITIPIIVNASLHYFLGHDGYVEIDLLATSMRLILITVFPVVAGMFVKYKYSLFSDRYQSLIARSSYWLLVIIIFVTIANNRDQMIEQLRALFIPLFALNIIAMLLGYSAAMVARLERKTAKTYAIEVGIQNSATGIYIAVSLLGNLQFAIPSMIYTGVAFFNVALFIFAFWIFSRHAKTT